MGRPQHRGGVQRQPLEGTPRESGSVLRGAAFGEPGGPASRRPRFLRRDGGLRRRAHHAERGHLARTGGIPARDSPPRKDQRAPMLWLRRRVGRPPVQWTLPLLQGNRHARERGFLQGAGPQLPPGFHHPGRFARTRHAGRAGHTSHSGQPHPLADTSLQRGHCGPPPSPKLVGWPGARSFAVPASELRNTWPRILRSA